jgi:hypothetical protein
MSASAISAITAAVLTIAATFTADEAMMVIEERMIVRSRGNLKE